jgi:4'-phosphopantetheinyl transferase EntD
MEVICAIRRLVPACAVVKGGTLDRSRDVRFPEEEALIANAVDKRRREFLAGRTYAREALAEFGLSPFPILAGPSRAPRWPPGFVGSISHSNSVCAVIVARASEIWSIGLDVDGDGPLDTELTSLVCGSGDLRDQDQVQQLTGIDPAKLVFVAKEAFYKLYNPLTASFLEFSDVEIRIDPVMQSFSAHLIEPSRPSFAGRRNIAGRFHSQAGTLIAVAVLAAGGAGELPAVSRQDNL